MNHRARELFNTREVHNIREEYSNATECMPELGLSMTVDGKPSIVDGKKQNFFSFKTPGFTITLTPQWVLHRTKERACRVVVHSHALHAKVLDYIVSSKVHPVHQTLSLTLSIVQDMEELADNQSKS